MEEMPKNDPWEGEAGFPTSLLWNQLDVALGGLGQCGEAGARW